MLNATAVVMSTDRIKYDRVRDLRAVCVAWRNHHLLVQPTWAQAGHSWRKIRKGHLRKYASHTRVGAGAGVSGKCVRGD